MENKTNTGFKNKQYIAVLIIIGLILMGLAYFFYINKTNPSSPIVNIIQNSIDSSGDIAYELRTTIAAGSTTTIPYLTSYSNQLALVDVNAKQDEFQARSLCFTKEDIKDDLIEMALFDNDNLLRKDLEQMTLEQIQNILVVNKGWYSETITNNVYAKNDILSFGYSSGSYCGGAYPNYGTYGQNYDLKTGTEIKLPELFEAYDQSPVINIFFEYYKKQYSTENLDDYEDCFEIVDPKDENSTFKYANFYLKDEEIIVMPALAHFAAPCQADVRVPLKEVVQYATKDSLLHILVK